MPTGTPPIIDDHPHEARVQSVEKLAKLMDSQFQIPGVPFPLGLDTLIGLVPVVGDTVGLGVSGFIVVEAARMGVPKRTLVQMFGNIGVDWAIGLIPVIGDMFDWGWKANNRNAAILRRHHDKTRAKAAKTAIHVNKPHV